jgi:hypothetical protein
VQGTAITIDNIQVRLFLNYSGTLSKNVASPHGYAMSKEQTEYWKMITDSRESPVDIVILVSLSGPVGESIEKPLIVSVVSDEKKPIAERRFEPGTLYFGPKGRLTEPVFGQDLGCDRLMITASIGSIRKSTYFNFSCGD